jgi:8-oxo-dGTP pyrophosphatase MutT (NUDIX family)
MPFDSFIEKLTTALAMPLPGEAGQQPMAARPINKTRYNFAHQGAVRQGGVLILLYPSADKVYFPLTQRHTYPGVHSGQVSLPGGKLEQDDEDLIATAIRETTEEIGVAGEDIRIIGRLSELYIQASHFRVIPSVGFVHKRPNFVLDKREVAKLIEVSIEELTDPRSRTSREMTVRPDLDLHIPYYSLQGHMVWGATAMILSEFVTIINQN